MPPRDIASTTDHVGTSALASIERTPDETMPDLFGDVSGLEVGLIVAALVLTLAVAAIFVVVITRNAQRDGHEASRASHVDRDDASTQQ